MNKKILERLFDMPRHKILYAIRLKEYVRGIWDTINAYGVPFSKENHEEVVEYVQTILEGHDLEREWSEEEYNNFVIYQHGVV